MTVKIPLSELGQTSAEDFDMCVRVHARDLLEHDAHHTKIAQGDTERVPYPPPVTVPLVDRAIRRPDFVPDYEIVDDTPEPPPPPTPEERLAAARLWKRSELGQAEAEAANAVVSPGKVRLFSLTEADIRSKPEKSRSKKDEAFLKEQEARGARLAAIYRHGAELEAQIEDLDEEALKTWQPAPFPEAK